MKASGRESEMQTLLQLQELCAFREAAHTSAAHVPSPADGRGVATSYGGCKVIRFTSGACLSNARPQ